MGKLPSTVLRRPTLAAASTTLSSTSSHTPASLLPSLPSTTSQQCTAANQVRHATFVPRSRRPYQFTQLVQLSDGSTFTMRTTSPQALFKSAKDSRNHILWQPTEKSLRNIEVDEAGKLAAFRERYGKGWDLSGSGAADAAAPAEGAAADATAEVTEKGGEKKVKEGDKKEAREAAAPAPAAAEEEDPFGSLVDLISAYATEDKNIKGGLSAKDQARKDKTGKKK